VFDVPGARTEKPNAPEKPQGPFNKIGVISAQAPYAPITAKQRIEWAAIERLAGDLMLARFLRGSELRATRPRSMGRTGMDLPSVRHALYGHSIRSRNRSRVWRDLGRKSALCP